MWNTACFWPCLNFFAWTDCRTVRSFLFGFFAILFTVAVNLGLTLSFATCHLFGFCFAETEAVIAAPCLHLRLPFFFVQWSFSVTAAALPMHSGLKRAAH